MKSSFYLIRVRGIPIGLNYSWFAIFLLITATLATYVFPGLYPEWSTASHWMIGLATSLLFFLSLLVHELAHSLVAQTMGIEVREITLFIFGGAARISREASPPRAETVMALAGPLASLGLAGVFALVWVLLEGVVEPLSAMGYYLCVINLLLAAFNLLPGFPLDGGRVLRSAVWWRTGNYKKATRIAGRAGQTLGLLFVVGGVPLGVLYYWFNGMWSILIGGFLWVAATASLRQAMLREGLAGLSAKDLMTGDCRLVPAQATVQALVDEYAPLDARRCLLVGDLNGIEGVVTSEDIKQVPRRRWSETSVAEAMTPLTRVGLVKPDDGALSVLERLGNSGTDILLVASGTTVVGAIEGSRVREVGMGRVTAA